MQQALSLSFLTKAATCCGPRVAVHTPQSIRACLHTDADQEEISPTVSRRQVLLTGHGLALTIAVAGVNGLPAGAAASGGKIYSEWEQVVVPVEPEVDLLDVGFVPGNWDHGFLVGTKKTFLETLDGGRSWSRCRLPDGLEDQDTLTSITFADRDGWIIGEPAVLLYTDDGGSNWRHVPLNLKTSETPLMINAFGENRAELVTREGGVYVTADGGVSWSMLEATSEGRVNSSILEGGALSKIDRSNLGEYVAVPSEGDAYVIWTPDQPWWRAHRDTNFVNIKSMFWLSDGSLWLVNKGGGLYFADSSKELNEFQESKASIQGIGVEDIGFRTRYEAWAAGAGGTLLQTFDRGETWRRDLVREDFSTNLTRVRFVDIGKGFIMGNGGVLLRHLAYKRKLQYIDVQSLRRMIMESEQQKQSQSL